MYPGYVVELRKRTHKLRGARRHEFRRHLIQAEIVGGQMMAHVSDVPNLEQQISRHLALYSEIVLVRNRRNLPRIEKRHGRIRCLPHRNRSECRRERLPRDGRKGLSVVSRRTPIAALVTV